MKYIYPALFTIEEDEDKEDKEDKENKKPPFITACVPDLAGCFSSGKGARDAFEQIRDAASVLLCFLEEEGKKPPIATDIQDIKAKENQYKSYIEVDTTEYRTLFPQFSQKKAKIKVTLPLWQEKLIKKNNIDVSFLIEEALQKALDKNILV